MLEGFHNAHTVQKQTSATKINLKQKKKIIAASTRWPFSYHKVGRIYEKQVLPERSPIMHYILHCHSNAEFTMPHKLKSSVWPEHLALCYACNIHQPYIRWMFDSAASTIWSTFGLVEKPAIHKSPFKVALMVNAQPNWEFSTTGKNQFLFLLFPEQNTCPDVMLKTVWYALEESSFKWCSKFLYTVSLHQLEQNNPYVGCNFKFFARRLPKVLICLQISPGTCIL